MLKTKNTQAKFILRPFRQISLLVYDYFSYISLPVTPIHYLLTALLRKVSFTSPKYDKYQKYNWKSIIIYYHQRLLSIGSSFSHISRPVTRIHPSLFLRVFPERTHENGGPARIGRTPFNAAFSIAAHVAIRLAGSLHRAEEIAASPITSLAISARGVWVRPKTRSGGKERKGERVVVVLVVEEED